MSKRVIFLVMPGLGLKDLADKHPEKIKFIDSTPYIDIQLDLKGKNVYSADYPSNLVQEIMHGELGEDQVVGTYADPTLIEALVHYKNCSQCMELILVFTDLKDWDTNSDGLQAWDEELEKEGSEKATIPFTNLYTYKDFHAIYTDFTLRTNIVLSSVSLVEASLESVVLSPRP